MDSARLQRLELTNFRGFAELALDFERDLTVLVGANGAGKTTLLDALVYCLWHSHTLPGDDLDCQPKDIRLGAEESLVHLSIGNDSGQSTKATWHARMFETRMKHEWQPGRFAAQRVVVYRVNRHARDLTPGTTQPRTWTRRDALETWHDASANYAEFFHWYKEMEDLENEQMRYEDGRENVQLAVVRRAITSLLPEFSTIRVRRHLPPMATQSVLAFRKGEYELPFDALSEGERTTIAMVGDLARRLTLMSDSANPLEQAVTVVVDEVEQHAHPGWQRQFIIRLRKTFPNAQFIVTTHSPVIVSEVKAHQLRVLKNYRLVETQHGSARTANTILEDVFHVPPRRQDVHDALDNLADAIEDDRFTEADILLAQLDKMVPDGSPDIVYYRELLRRLREP